MSSVTPRPVAGWRVLLTTFCMALAAVGLGFYSLSGLCAVPGGQRVSFCGLAAVAATTFHFLVGGALYAVGTPGAGRLAALVVVALRVLLMAGCASALATCPMPSGCSFAYAGMAFGWAAISGTAITQIIGRWFVLGRGLAL